MTMKRYSSITRGSSRRTSLNKKRIGVVVLLSVFLILLIWFVPFVFGFFASLVIAPIQATHTWLYESSSNLPFYLRDRSALIEENIELRQSLAVADGSEHQVRMLRKENEELRTLLGGREEERLMAGVIGRPSTLPYDVLVIDQGSLAGVEVDAPVYIGDDRVIGQVVTVFPQSSIVALVTSPGFESSVYIEGPDIYTNAIGMGGGQLRVGVPQGIKLTEGDQVILPAVAPGLFGTINHVESSPTGPEQFGFVSTDVPLQSLHYVAVGKSRIVPVSFEEAQEHVESSLTRLFTVPVPEGILVVTEPASTTATSSDADAASSTGSTEP